MVDRAASCSARARESDWGGAGAKVLVSGCCCGGRAASLERTAFKPASTRVMRASRLSHGRKSSVEYNVSGVGAINAVQEGMCCRAGRLLSPVYIDTNRVVIL